MLKSEDHAEQPPPYADPDPCWPLQQEWVLLTSWENWPYIQGYGPNGMGVGELAPPQLPGLTKSSATQPTSRALTDPLSIYPICDLLECEGIGPVEP